MTTLKAIWASLQCCLNWKVIAGAGGIAGAVLLLQPRAAGTVVSLAIALVCPLSMGIMMWRMRGGTHGAPMTPSTDEEIQALSDEVARLRAAASPTRAAATSVVPPRVIRSRDSEVSAVPASATN